MQNMEEIYQQHFHTVYRYLCCLTGQDEHLAEELCQETFFQAVKSIHRQAVENALAKLPQTEQEVLSLRLLGELSFNEIATITGHSENWARVTFFRGKQKVKEALQDEF